MRRIWRDYGLGLVLFALFAVSWALQTWTGWREFIAEQQANGQSAHWFGSEGYVWAWSQATFENWQSEFLQLFAMVALTSFLIFRGSPESRDSDDEMKAMLKQMQQQLDELTAAQPAPERPRAPQRAA